MKKLALLGSVLFLCSLTLDASAYKGEKLAKHTKISIEQARDIALRKYPGVVKHEELRAGKGCHKLCYSFSIEEGSTMQTVGIDAKTGNVVRYRVEDYKGK